ncbi:hypothetical protein [Inhella gelatinilytica]|uniref:Uncharacterized protein n=1 Tax=Inhella gelatinilytica TaxID=2795030 RepID=A0A931IWP8_9BURK|nr:hypothetical protein [Inhella gelatinilytica]MBH9552956.1 hypothetical protein [Inhella gelatinilytica]
MKQPLTVLPVRLFYLVTGALIAATLAWEAWEIASWGKLLGAFGWLIFALAWALNPMPLGRFEGTVSSFMETHQRLSPKLYRTLLFFGIGCVTVGFLIRWVLKL